MFKSGDRVTFGIWHGVIDEIEHDGRCFVVFDDGTAFTMKWEFLDHERASDRPVQTR